MSATHPPRPATLFGTALTRAATVLIGLTAACAAPVAHAGIALSDLSSSAGDGPFTVSVTAPIEFTITRTGYLSALVFEEWVQIDGTSAKAGAIGQPRSLSYLVEGLPGELQVALLRVTAEPTTGAITGIESLVFVNGLPVNAGQTLAIKPSSVTFKRPKGLNMGLPSAFDGQVFLAGGDGAALSNMVSLNVPAAVPEPASLALTGLALAAAGAAARRGRTA